MSLSDKNFSLVIEWKFPKSEVIILYYPIFNLKKSLIRDFYFFNTKRYKILKRLFMSKFGTLKLILKI